MHGLMCELPLVRDALFELSARATGQPLTFLVVAMVALSLERDGWSTGGDRARWPWPGHSCASSAWCSCAARGLPPPRMSGSRSSCWAPDWGCRAGGAERVHVGSAALAERDGRRDGFDDALPRCGAGDRPARPGARPGRRPRAGRRRAQVRAGVFVVALVASVVCAVCLRRGTPRLSRRGLRPGSCAPRCPAGVRVACRRRQDPVVARRSGTGPSPVCSPPPAARAHARRPDSGAQRVPDGDDRPGADAGLRHDVRSRSVRVRCSRACARST